MPVDMGASPLAVCWRPGDETDGLDGEAEDSDAWEHTLSLVSSGVRARQAWESADLRRRLQELQHEYGEQGSAVSQCDSTYTIMKIVC